MPKNAIASPPHALHFIGIGGIGMSGLATIVLERGVSQVSGTDVKAGGVIEGLKAMGAHIAQGHDKEHLPSSATVVVSTDIPADNPELVEARRRGQKVLHRSDLLKDLMTGYQVLAVTGTHGKTTTTSLLSHVLMEAGEDPAFAVGGILLNYGFQARHGEGQYFVAEADESDGTFLKYPYTGAIVTNIDSDHIAHFGSIEKLEEAFGQFVKNAPLPERLFFCGDDARLKKICTKGISYGFGSTNDLRIEHVVSTEQGIVFDIRFRRKLFRSITLQLHGRHNALNAAAVFGLALTLGLPEETVRGALSTFRGVKRRLERKESGAQCLIFDDYAHHPTEMKATIQALRQRIGERRLIVVFQPHRPSRMQYCMEDLAGAFVDADCVVVTDLYLANEPVRPNVTSQKIFDVVHASHKDLPCYFLGREALTDGLFPLLRPHDVLLFFGAGDITKASDEMAARLFSTPVQKWKVGVVYGGMNSANRSSRLSARAVWEALDPLLYSPVAFEIDQQGRWRKTQGIECDERGTESTETFSKGVWPQLQSCDVFIPVLHGPFGEDGTIQGFFEMLHKPYVGCSTKACAVSMDRVMAKQVVQAANVPVLPYVVVYRSDWNDHAAELVSEVTKKLRAPYFVKPAHCSSSVGVERVEQSGQLHGVIDRVMACDEKVLIEQIIPGRTIEFAVFGHEHIFVPPPGEMRMGGNGTSKEGMNVVPAASLTEEQLEQGQMYMRKAYQALGCSGLNRMDCFLDENGHWYFHEAHPFPSFTNASLYPAVWNGQGVSYAELINRLIILALSRFRLSRRLAANASALGCVLERMCVV
jgi:UDP-N-acetylmuramate--alanine ligase